MAYHYVDEYRDWPYYLKPLGMAYKATWDAIFAFSGFIPACIALVIVNPLWHISEILEQTVVVIR